MDHKREPARNFRQQNIFLRCSMIVLWFQDMSDTYIHWDQCFHAIFNTFRCVNLSRTCVTFFDSIRPLAIAKICKTDSPPKISKIDTTDALADAMLTFLSILLTTLLTTHLTQYQVLVDKISKTWISDWVTLQYGFKRCSASKNTTWFCNGQ